MAEADQAAATGGDATGASATGDQGGSVLGGAAPVDTTHFIPEKYRTNKEDGTLDLEASSRKVAEAYGHLEKRLGSGDAPPKSVDEYAPALTVEGVAWDEFKADPVAQEFLKGAHAKGLTNEQLAFVVDSFHQAVPGLVEGKMLVSSQDCTAALKAAWGDDAAMKQNLGQSYRAAQAFANEAGKPGNFDTLMAKYGNDPDFIAFTANIGKELREDAAINNGQVMNEADFAIQTDTLRKELEALPPHDPKRPGVQAKLNDLYDRKYGAASSKMLAK